MKPILLELFVSLVGLGMIAVSWPTDPLGIAIGGCLVGVGGAFAFVMFDFRNIAFVDTRRR